MAYYKSLFALGGSEGMSAPVQPGGDAGSVRPWLLSNPNMTIDECQLPPPRFPVPPPPRPPYLPDLSSACSFHSCSIRPVIDAEYHSSPALPSFISITVGSALVFLMLLIFTTLLCKHQKKMRNLLPCKSLPHNHCDMTHQNGIIYEDMMNIQTRALSQAPIEMIDVKRNKAWLGVGYSPPSYPVMKQTPLYICPPAMNQHQHFSQDLYNPVYEEISNGSDNKRIESEETSEYDQRGQCSEDDFAEDELSVTGFPIRNYATVSYDSAYEQYKDRRTENGQIHKTSSSNDWKTNKYRKVKSFEKKRSRVVNDPTFHEGLLLDALFQLCPNRSVSAPHHQFPCILPISNSKYDTVFKTDPKNSDNRVTIKPSNDSDSGYSHNTSGNGSTKKNRKHCHYISESPKILLS